MKREGRAVEILLLVWIRWILSWGGGSTYFLPCNIKWKNLMWETITFLFIFNITEPFGPHASLEISLILKYYNNMSFSIVSRKMSWEEGRSENRDSCSRVCPHKPLGRTLLHLNNVKSDRTAVCWESRNNLDALRSLLEESEWSILSLSSFSSAFSTPRV
jgi:hypothetical protein